MEGQEITTAETVKPPKKYNPGGYMQQQTRYIMAALNYVPAMTLQLHALGVMPYTVEHLLAILHAQNCHVWKDATTLRPRLSKLIERGMVQRIPIKYATGNRFMTRKQFSGFFLPGRAAYDLGVISSLQASYADPTRPDPVAVAMSNVTLDQVQELQRWCRAHGIPDPFACLPHIPPVPKSHRREVVR